MNDKEVNKYLRAARQRLASAEFLMTGGMNLDAIYLAGYGAECAIKGLILAGIPVDRRKTFRTKWFHGKRSHDFEHLRFLLRRNGVAIPRALTGWFRALISWSTDLRYESGFRPSKDAEEFLRAVTEIVIWVERTK